MDGQIVFQQHSLSDSADLSAYIMDLNSGLNIESSQVGDPKQWIWSVTAAAEGSKDRHSGYTDTILGCPRDISRWFSTVRHWSPWLAPRHGKSKFSADSDSILTCFLRNDGLHVVLLAISGLDDILTVLKADSKGNIIISSRNDGQSQGTTRILVSVGKDLDSTLKIVINQARGAIWQEQEGPANTEAQLQKYGGVEPKWFEYWYDGLGYCTWNSLGQNLSEEKILNALEDLNTKNIRISNLIIDDNWQSLSNNGWVEFEANKNFPGGLKHTIDTIRGKYQHIQHIAVWHALMGYWGGISPTGKINDTYQCVDVKVGGNTLRVVDAADVSRFYENFYRFLWECHIDAVKTDAQFFLDELVHADDRRRLTKAYQDAYYFPEIPESHPWHIFCNAHNSTFTSHLNVLPDWDMFQTSHLYASFHAAARCISGGPIYITDEPGKHNVSLISQFVARTVSGKTVILRPDLVGKTTEPYTAYDAERLLKVANFTGRMETGTSLLAVFNVSKRSLVELVPLRGFLGICGDKNYIVRAHSTGEISKILPGDSRSDTSLLVLDLPPCGWEILSAYPLQTIHFGSGDDTELLKFANLGLLEKMTGAAAVLNTNIRIPDSSSTKLKIEVSLRALGVLGLYMSNLSRKSIDSDFLILVLGRVIPRHTVTKSEKIPELLMIDVEKAWDEMGLSSGWNNEGEREEEQQPELTALGEETARWDDLPDAIGRVEMAGEEKMVAMEERIEERMGAIEEALGGLAEALGEGKMIKAGVRRVKAALGSREEGN
ncbi:hypothetical protein FGG08_006219 [Glutinoglossum americanum]|uniref:Alpha-galactosidase n=1 Tax=Glutinoglossum americanum TaxID=1670608 RepID=A0A9P8I5Q5_9PEZI|nr:hypothetical protein FGG08_006219 [Glutinoglossum americanum]